MLSGMEEYSEQLNGTTLELHGDILFKLNKVEEAVVQWKKAKNMRGISNKIILKIEQKQYY